MLFSTIRESDLAKIKLNESVNVQFANDQAKNNILTFFSTLLCVTVSDSKCNRYASNKPIFSPAQSTPITHIQHVFTEMLNCVTKLRLHCLCWDWGQTFIGSLPSECNLPFLHVLALEDEKQIAVFRPVVVGECIVRPCVDVVVFGRRDWISARLVPGWSLLKTTLLANRHIWTPNDADLRWRLTSREHVFPNVCLRELKNADGAVGTPSFSAEVLVLDLIYTAELCIGIRRGRKHESTWSATGDFAKFAFTEPYREHLREVLC